MLLFEMNHSAESKCGNQVTGAQIDIHTSTLYRILIPSSEEKLCTMTLNLTIDP